MRDAAILAVLYTSGVRGEDPVTRTLADWDPQSDGIRVLGKGNKDIQFTAPVVRSRVTHTDSRAISGSYACHSRFVVAAKRDEQDEGRNVQGAARAVH
ncbi:hypothetical protein [Nonomuraea sp. NPDC049480]|uniref:hypothetical protein n=1 Tax=Nonomuraea sp. NPDC049480 TaxID=3364353 RepID=UPI00378B328C